MLPVGLAAILALPILAYLTAPEGSSGVTTLATVVAALALIPFAVAWLRGALDPGEPIFGVAIIYFLLFSGRALYIQADPIALSNFSAHPYGDALQTALVLAVAGFILLLAGYYAPFGGAIAARLPQLAGVFSTTGTKARVFVLLAIGVGTQLVLTLAYGQTFFAEGQGVNRNNENFLLQLGYFSNYGLAVAAIAAANARAAGRGGFWRNPFLLAGCAAAAVVGLLYSQKSNVISAAVIVSLVYNYRVRRIPLRLAVGVAFVVLFLVFPLISTQRALREEGYLSGSSATSDRLTSGAGGVVASFVADPTQFAREAYGSLIARENGVDSLALIIKYTPVLGQYKSPAQFLQIPAMAYIPRFAWPGKPVLSGTEFGEKYLGYFGPASISITNFGDFYIHGGLWVLLCGAFVLGLFYRILYAWLVRDGRLTDSALLLYVVFATTIFETVDANVVTTYAQLAKSLPIVLLVAQFVCAGNGRLLKRAPRV